MLRQREIDLAMTLLESKPAEGLCAQALFELPLVLMVPKKCRFKAAEDLWKTGMPTEPLLCLSEGHAITRRLQEGLERLDIEWFPRMELGSVELVESYVEKGQGIGVSVAVPRSRPNAKVRLLPLKDFAPV